MGTVDCRSHTDSGCRNEELALHMKTVAIFIILIASAFGVAFPLLARRLKCVRMDGIIFVFSKAFATGVILATGFVHLLPDAQEALTDDCLPETPWLKFPFADFIAMLAVLFTLLADFVSTQYYERKQLKDRVDTMACDTIEERSWPKLGHASSTEDANQKNEDALHGDGHMHIVGIHAHVASHNHNHPHGHESCADETHAHTSPSMHDFSIRHTVVSQVLEMGIISHSVIIGLSLGVSQSPCIIRPLVATLTFHQFFEGLALGGCVSQASFKSLYAFFMACLFAITTPACIAIGTGVSSISNPNEPRALILEGIFDSISAGILIYMSLVDLIATDFLSKKMYCSPKLQCVSYIALLMGGTVMASLAIWA